MPVIDNDGSVELILKADSRKSRRETSSRQMDKLSADILEGNPMGFRADVGGTDTIDQLANNFYKS